MENKEFNRFQVVGGNYKGSRMVIDLAALPNQEKTTLVEFLEYLDKNGMRFEIKSKN